MIAIHLTKRNIAIVSDEDENLNDHKWSTVAAANHKIPYAGCQMTRPDGRRQMVLMHRLIMQRVLGRPLVEGELVDHIDGNGLNNLRSNLRLATRAQNVQNRKINSNSESGYKGVTRNKQTDIESWKAHIFVNGKQKFIGSYPTPELAHQAYCEAGRFYFGEFFNPG